MKFKIEFKKHALTAISYMLPLVVASGLLIAIGNLLGGIYVEDFSEPISIASSFTTLGVLGMGLLPSFISGYISYSIADRPGIAPGFLMGMIAKVIGAGFLGGMVGGFLVGYIVLILKEYLKVPNWAQGLMPMMIIPTLSSIIGGLIMFFVLGIPIVILTESLTNFIISMEGSSKVVYGFVFGVLGCFDFGGPISKVPNLFADGLLLEGILEPEGIKVLGAMVPPFGLMIALIFSKIFNKKIFTAEEEENIKVAFPMGCCMITEGVIPIAMNDLVKTVISSSLGCGVCGAISFVFGNGSPVPSGGIFVIPVMTRPLVAIIALLIGSIVTGTVMFLIKNKITVEENNKEKIDEEEIDLSNLKITEI